MQESTKNVIFRFLIPGVLLIALLLVCLWATSSTARADELERQLQSSYLRAAYTVAESAGDMHTALQKLQIVNSPGQYILLLDDLWRLSGTGVSALSQIPAQYTDNGELGQFLNRTGDYARTLTKKVSAGAVLTREEIDQLTALGETCAALSGQLWQRLQDGTFLTVEQNAGAMTDNTPPRPAVTAETSPLPQQETPDDGVAFNDAAQAQSQPQAGTQPQDGGQPQAGTQPQDGAQPQDGTQAEGSDTANTEENAGPYPTLIYDGPFSESTEKAQPQGLSGPQVGEEQALQAALSYIGGGELTSTGQNNGNIPCYGFSGTTADGRSVDVAVTLQEGKILWMQSTAEIPQTPSVKPDEAEVNRCRAAALQYLVNHGFSGMTPAYAQFYDGVIVFNFAATQDGVILYNDLVKVWVERANRRVTGVDARNYYSSHRERELAEPLIDEQSARGNLSAALEVQQVTLALIPSGGTAETLCWECKGTYGGVSYIVYINARTGAEEEIFQIIDSDEGQLVV